MSLKGRLSSILKLCVRGPPETRCPKETEDALNVGHCNRGPRLDVGSLSLRSKEAFEPGKYGGIQVVQSHVTSSPYQ